MAAPATVFDDLSYRLPPASESGTVEGGRQGRVVPRRGRVPSPLRARGHGDRALVDSFIRSLEQLDPGGGVRASLDHPERLGYVAATHVLARAHWTAHLGPFYSERSVRTLMGDDASSDGLLALTTRSGQVVYPAFQFDEAAPVRGLSAVLALLGRAQMSPWTVASWLASPKRDLDGQAPIAALRAGQEERVRTAAARWAERLG